MLVVAKRSLAAVSLAGGGRGGHGGLLPLNFLVALTLSIGAITLTVIHKYYIYENSRLLGLPWRQDSPCSIHITEAWFESYKVATVAGDARRFYLEKRRGGRLKVEQRCLLLKEWQVEM